MAFKGARTPGKKASSAFGGLRSNGARLTLAGALVGAPGRESKVYTMYLNLDIFWLAVSDGESMAGPGFRGIPVL